MKKYRITLPANIYPLTISAQEFDTDEIGTLFLKDKKGEAIAAFASGAWLTITEVSE